MNKVQHKHGKHYFTQGGINHPQVNEMIKERYPEGIDFCYTDPPWGTGNLNYWKTMNNKANPINMTEQLDQEQLEVIVADTICDNVINYAFIVYGIREAESLMKKFKAKPNVKDVQYIKKKYQSGSKWYENCIIIVTLNNAEVRDFSELNGQNGIKSLKTVCEMFKGKFRSCLEMFVGIGYYAKVLDKYGFDIIGNELNAARLEKAIAKLPMKFHNE